MFIRTRQMPKIHTLFKTNNHSHVSLSDLWRFSYSPLSPSCGGKIQNQYFVDPKGKLNVVVTNIIQDSSKCSCTVVRKTVCSIPDYLLFCIFVTVQYFRTSKQI